MISGISVYSNHSRIMACLKVIIFLIFNSYVEGGLVKDASNFGPYVMEWKSYSVCNGPKTHNVTDVQLDFVQENDKYVAYMNITFLEEAMIDEIRITVYNNKGNSKNAILNYKVKDPCHHYTFGNMIKELMHTKNCIVKKGLYATAINLTDLVASFLGSSFFYGELTFKIMTVSKKGNIVCFIFETAFRKPKP